MLRIDRLGQRLSRWLELGSLFLLVKNLMQFGVDAKWGRIGALVQVLRYLDHIVFNLLKRPGRGLNRSADLINGKRTNANLQVNSLISSTVCLCEQGATPIQKRCKYWLISEIIAS